MQRKYLLKKIGLIGGMSWESSLVYYKYLNELVRGRLGGFHSAHCIMESVDFAEIEKLQHKDDWESLTRLMVNAAIKLEEANADCIVLCTNTMHRCYREIEKNLSIPFLHIAEATARAIKTKGLNEILLLGTRFTMEQDFFKNYLEEKYNLTVIIPAEKDRILVHEIIYTELVQGLILNKSRNEFMRIIGEAESKGAQGVILGCTEIPLLVNQADVSLPVFDTTRLHAEYAVDFAFK